MKITRIEHFNAAHRLHNEHWSVEQNNRIFGKCNNPNYHGHNYKIEVQVSGKIDPETGYVMDMKILSDLVKQEILERFDHRNFNLDCPEFKNLIPTAENIALVCWQILRPHIDAANALVVKLWETDRNWVETNGE